MNRGNRILAGIFGALLILVLVLENPFGRSVYELGAESAPPLFPSFHEDKAVKIEIRKASGGEEALLEKDSSGTWVVANQHGYKAQEGRVKGLLQKLPRFQTSDLIDEEAADLDKPYNLGQNGIEVKVLDAAGGILAGFVQGKIDGDWKDPDYQRRMRKLPSFLRKLDERRVYEVPEFTALIAKAQDWLDTTLVRFDATKVREISLAGKLVEEGEIELRKEGEEWKLAKPEEAPAKKEVVEAMARSLSSAYFKELVGPLDDPARFELAEPQLKVRMKLETGEEHGLLVGKQLEDKSYYVTKGENEKFVFVVQAYTVDSLKKTVADLKFVPPSPAEKKEEPPKEGEEPKKETPPEPEKPQ